MFRYLVFLLISLLPASGLAAQGVPAIERGLVASFVIYSDDDEDRFLGSGFVWDEGSLGVTNAHVVGDAARVRIVYRDGHEERVRVIARAPRRDVALLRLGQRRPGLKPVGRALPVGAEVIALGAPMGLGFTATRGIVSAAPRQVDPAVPMRLIQHDAALNPGSSGGALIDGQGRLVGMNSRIADGSRLFIGISYAIPAADLTRIIAALSEARLPPVPDLGLDVRPVDARIAGALGIARAGVLVDRVRPGSAAECAGIRAGDVIAAIGGAEVTRPGDIAFLIETAKEGVTMTLFRAGQPVDLTLSLLTPPPRPGPSRTGGAPDFSRITLAGLSVRLDPDGEVIDLAPDSAPARQGLETGDRILALNGQPFAPDRVGTAEVEAPFVLLVERDGMTRHVIVDPGSTRPGLHTVGRGNSLDLSVVRF